MKNEQNLQAFDVKQNSLYCIYTELHTNTDPHGGMPVFEMMFVFVWPNEQRINALDEQLVKCVRRLVLFAQWNVNAGSVCCLGAVRINIHSSDSFFVLEMMANNSKIAAINNILFESVEVFKIIDKLKNFGTFKAVN